MASSIRSRSELLLVVAALAWAAPVLAKGGAAEAKAAAKAARQAFDLGKFELALQKYQEAYELKPVPGLLFNLGQCHRQLGNAERALFYFKRYLESGPPAGQAKATRELVTKLEEKVAADRDKKEADDAAARQLELEQARTAAANAEAAAAEQHRKALTDAAERSAQARKEEAERRRHDLEASLKARPPPPAETPITQRWYFWGGLAAGVVAASAATVGIVLATQPHPTPTTFPDISAR